MGRASGPGPHGPGLFLCAGIGKPALCSAGASHWAGEKSLLTGPRSSADSVPPFPPFARGGKGRLRAGGATIRRSATGRERPRQGQLFISPVRGFIPDRSNLPAFELPSQGRITGQRDGILSKTNIGPEVI